MRALPTTYDFIEEIALRDPARPAFLEEDAGLGYGQLHGMLAQAALQLQRLGVRHGDRVAVSGPGFGIQLVLLLACEGLGALTASFQAEDDPDTDFLFGHMDHVFSGRPQAVPAGVKFHLLDADFARALAQPVAGAWPRMEPQQSHETARITRTSGSTGRSKFMRLSRHAQEYWIAVGAEKVTYNHATRMLVLAPLVMNSALTRSSVVLRRGGMVIVNVPGARVPSLGLTHVWGLPLQLDQLLGELPEGWVSPQPVQVSTVGGAITPAMRETLARVFHGWTRNRYGSNEAGGICEEMDADGTGVLCPGVEVRILGPQGEDLPPGQAGTIAVRSVAVVDGYLDRPEETAAAFRDGWFISSDVGMLVGHRRLRLLGRQDDLVNVGGIKWPAAQLEAELAAQPAIAECSVQAVNLEHGAVTLGVAVVLTPGATQAEATAQLREGLRLPAQTAVRLLFVPALPRLLTGKVDRMALLRQWQGAR